MAMSPGPGFRRWSALLAQAGEPVVVLDCRARVLFVNRSWERLTGFASEDIVGKSCRESDPSPPFDEVLKGLVPPSEAMAGNPAGLRTLVAHRDGSPTWRRADFLPFHDGYADLLGFLLIFRNAEAASTAENAASQETRIALEEAREIARNRRVSGAIVGSGSRHHRLLLQVAAAGATRIPVLIVGESGVGKRHVARAIHDHGPAADARLLLLNPALVTPDKLEQELFASDQASWNHGIFSEGSTILLEDVANLSRDVQAKLVVASRDTTVRILATSSVDPDHALRDGLWKSDFYYAITSLIIRMDPLRERLDELPILAQHFLEEACLRSHRRSLGLLPEAVKSLSEYDWPGNLRELRRVMETAERNCQGMSVGVEDLPATIRGELASSYLPPPLSAATMPLDAWLARLEKRLIELALHRSRQNKSRAAEILEVSRPRLYRRIKDLNIPDLPETQGGGPA